MAQKSLIIKKFLFGYKMVNHLVLLIRRDVYSRYRQMFFDQVGHQTMSAYIVRPTKIMNRADESWAHF